jgi:hypothetical protein
LVAFEREGMQSVASTCDLVTSVCQLDKAERCGAAADAILPLQTQPRVAYTSVCQGPSSREPWPDMAFARHYRDETLGAYNAAQESVLREFEDWWKQQWRPAARPV